MVRRLPFLEERMLKLNQFGYGTSIMVDILHKSGESFIPMIWVANLTRRRELSIVPSVWLLILHSTSDLDSQCKELPNVLEPVILPSRNGLRIEKLSNSDSTQSPRLSEACTGLLMYSQWKETILDAEPITQDGSNSLSGEHHTSETKKNKKRLWMFQEVLMLKTEISTCGNSKVVSNNNGILS
jgi:hypothetical protein